MGRYCIWYPSAKAAVDVVLAVSSPVDGVAALVRTRTLTGTRIIPGA